MTIGLVIDDTLDKPDGVQAAVVAIGTELTRQGHEVHYIVPHTERTDIKHVHAIGSYLSLPFNGNSVRTPLPLSRRRVKKLFQRVQFDVLHVQMPYSPVFAGRIIKAAPKHTNIVGTFHILPYTNLTAAASRALGLVSRRSFKRFTSVIAVSRPAKKFCTTIYGRCDDVLPNPVDHAFFQTFKKPADQRQDIVFVGRFEARKGAINLIKGYSLLPNKIRQMHRLVMCGEGPQHEEAKKLANKLQLHVELPGFVTNDEKAEALSRARVAVFPSTSGESFGIVLAEAMSVGADVTVGGDNPGYASVLHPWPNTLFDAASPQAITNSLAFWLNSSDERSRTGSSQHRAVVAFDVKAVVDRLLSDFYS